MTDNTARAAHSEAPPPPIDGNARVARFEAPPLPAKASDWQRKVKDNRTLNDRVEDLHLEYLEADERYRQLLTAVHDEQSVEGKVNVDRAEAARLLREYAKTKSNPIGDQKLVTIRRCLTVVMARYGESLREREAKQIEVTAASDD